MPTRSPRKVAHDLVEFARRNHLAASEASDGTHRWHLVLGEQPHLRIVALGSEGEPEAVLYDGHPDWLAPEQRTDEMPGEMRRRLEEAGIEVERVERVDEPEPEDEHLSNPDDIPDERPEPEVTFETPMDLDVMEGDPTPAAYREGNGLSLPITESSEESLDEAERQLAERERPDVRDPDPPSSGPEVPRTPSLPDADLGADRSERPAPDPRPGHNLSGRLAKEADCHERCIIGDNRVIHARECPHFSYAVPPA